MKKRTRINNRKSKKLFRKTSGVTNVRNLKLPNMRGGYRL